MNSATLWTGRSLLTTSTSGMRATPATGMIPFAKSNGSDGSNEELSPKVGDGGNREGGISWGCLTPPLLHRRSDMPCPRILSYHQSLRQWPVIMAAMRVD